MSAATEKDTAKAAAKATGKTPVGDSPAMAAVLAQAQRAGRSGETVLLLGESGTGKELLARVIHATSPRNARPFVAVNCGALPESLVESILFGHKKGAFTGAEDQTGKFRDADGGTLFLDEVGELSPAVQVRLLRALQERVVEPLGGRPVSVDVRVVAATHRDLGALIRGGSFREDLYYRLDVLKIRLPPLRDRREDIPALVARFLEEAGQAHRWTPGATTPLLNYAWPGNVRQLQNLIKKALHATDGTVGHDLIEALLRDAEPHAPSADTKPGAQTRPAATTVTSTSSATVSLALAWWRFRQNDHAGQAYVCTLDALERPVRLEEVTFVDGRARIGRERGQAEVVLDSQEVSRAHATIRRVDGGFVVEDAGSRNRTFVDGHEVETAARTPLRTGSVLRVGKEWLGIAIVLNPGAIPESFLPPAGLVARLRARGETGEALLDIKVVEGLCAGSPGEAALARAASRLRRRTVAPGLDLLELAKDPALDWRKLTPTELDAFIETTCGGNQREAARRLGISPTTLLKARRR